MPRTELSAAHQMASENLGLIGWTLGRYFRWLSEDEKEDAWQDGYFGLLRAAEKYDPETGNRFSTYAVIWIRQFINRGIDWRAGANHRRAKHFEEEPPTVLSLDWEYEGERSFSMADMLESGDMVDDEACAAADAASVAAVLVPMCRDDVDRAALVWMLSDESMSSFADQHGVHRQTFAMRIERLKGMYRHPTARPLPKSSSAL